MTKHPNGTMLFRIDIRCPVCQRKLMTLQRAQKTVPDVSVIDSAKPVAYRAETRCPGCHSYIGITI